MKLKSNISYCFCNMLNEDIALFRNVSKCLKCLKTEICNSPHIVTFLSSEKHLKHYNFDKGGKAVTKTVEKSSSQEKTKNHQLVC